MEEDVIAKMGSFWQSFDIQNDQAIDGMIFIGKKGKLTGRIIYAQVKTGDSYLNRLDDACLTLKFDSVKLLSWRSIWKSKKEPVILIYVKDRKNKYWVYAKDETIYKGKTQVLIPTTNKFNEKTKSVLIKMSGKLQGDKTLSLITCKRIDRPYLYNRKELKISAKNYYDRLKMKGFVNYQNKYFSDLKFTRLGWNHINSRKRSLARQRHSLEMMGVVKLILENVSRYDILKVEKKENVMSEYLGLKSKVTFSERTEGIIQAVIVRKKIFLPDGNYEETKWFLSVHEIIKK